jgi:hypothetical protein
MGRGTYDPHPQLFLAGEQPTSRQNQLFRWLACSSSGWTARSSPLGPAVPRASRRLILCLCRSLAYGWVASPRTARGTSETPHIRTEWLLVCIDSWNRPLHLCPAVSISENRPTVAAERWFGLFDGRRWVSCFGDGSFGGVARPTSSCSREARRNGCSMAEQGHVVGASMHERKTPRFIHQRGRGRG